MVKMIHLSILSIRTHHVVSLVLANKTGAANGENDSFIHPFDKNTPSCFFSSSISGLNNLCIFLEIDI